MILSLSAPTRSFERQQILQALLRDLRISQRATWTCRSSGVWCCVLKDYRSRRFEGSYAFHNLRLLDHEDNVTTVFRNVGHYSLSDRVVHPTELMPFETSGTIRSVRQTDRQTQWHIPQDSCLQQDRQCTCLHLLLIHWARNARFYDLMKSSYVFM
jgi:hypothetical protein